MDYSELDYSGSALSRRELPFIQETEMAAQYNRLLIQMEQIGLQKEQIAMQRQTLNLLRFILGDIRGIAKIVKDISESKDQTQINPEPLSKTLDALYYRIIDWTEKVAGYRDQTNTTNKMMSYKDKYFIRNRQEGIVLQMDKDLGDREIQGVAKYEQRHKSHDEERILGRDLS
ncbi:hypothetical protein RRF57_011275 [Xylaria bambusicola]|uniref:Uncharacterized protein n=1 Tax=Xylaria bambusicola TaxID=326684 RepID=A0AAN7UUM0_9PEZI